MASRSIRIRLGRWLLAAVLAAPWAPLVGCGVEVPRNNPFDADAPQQQQHSGSVGGVVLSRTTRPETVAAIDEVALAPMALGGASVRLLNGNGELVAITVTQEDGSYTFGDLTPGTYVIDVSHPTHYRETRQLLVLPGGTLQLDVWVLALPTMPLTGRIQGQAVLSNPDPKRDHSGILVETQGAGFRTTTNQSGQFDLFVPAGLYTLHFAKPGFAGAARGGVTVTAASVVAVPNNPVVLSAIDGSLTGLVRLEGAYGGEHGGVEVTLGADTNTFSTPDGSYAFTGLEEGTYARLTATRAGYETTSLAPVVVSGGAQTVLPTLVLRRLQGTIAGTVLLAAGVPAAGAWVQVVGTTRGTLTGIDGSFEFSGNPVGTYDISVGYPDTATTTVSGVVVDSNELTSIDPITLTPAGGSVVINGGELFTDARWVTLHLARAAGYRLRVALDSALLLPDSELPFVDFSDSLSYELTAGDGAKTVLVQFENSDGSRSRPFAASIVLDTTPPVIDAVTLDGGRALSRDARGVITVAIDAHDSTSGVTHMQVGATDDPNAPYDAFTPEFPYQVATWDADGAKTLYVRVRDAAGNATVLAQAATIELDRTPPALTHFTSRCDGHDNPSYCNESFVELSIDSPDAVGMILSNDPAFPVETVEPYAAARLWLLAPGDGQRTIALKLVDAAGNVTAVPTTLTTTVDTTPPSAFETLVDTPRTAADTAHVTLARAANDAHGVNYELFGGHYGAWTPAGAPPPWVFELRRNGVLAEGTHQLGVRAVDAAGNVSIPVVVTVTRDRTPPAPPTGLAVRLDRDADADADAAVITWDPSSSSDAAGYRLFYGTRDTRVAAEFDGWFAQQGASPIDVGPDLSITLTGIGQRAGFFVAVEAYDGTVAGGGPNRSELSQTLAIVPSPLQPTLAARVAGPGTRGSGALAASESRLVVAHATRGLEIYDTGAAEFFSPLGGLTRATVRGHYDVQLWGRHVFVTCGASTQCDPTPGAQVIDMTDPENPIAKGHFPAGVTARVMHLLPTGQYAYATYLDTTDGLYKLVRYAITCSHNCADASSMFTTLGGPGGAAATLPGASLAADANDDLVAVATGASTLTLVDVADAAATPIPRQVPLAKPATTLALHFPFVFVGHAVGGDGGLSILDLRRPSGSLVVGSVAGFDCQNIVVSGSVAICATGAEDGGAKLVAVSISDKTRPVVIGRVSDASPPAARVGLKRIATAAGSGGSLFGLGEVGGDLEAFDLAVANGLQPSGAAAGTEQPTFDVRVAGNLAYAAGLSTREPLTIFDIGDPHAPVKLGALPAFGTAGTTPERPRIDLQGSYATWASGADNLLRIIDISDPTAPVVVNTVDTGGVCFAAKQSGNLVFVGRAGVNVRRYPMFDPTALGAPVWLPDSQVTNVCSDLALQDGYVYFVERADPAGIIKLRQIDARSPDALALRGAVTLVNNAPAGTHALSVAGRYAYVGSNANGLMTIDLFGESGAQAPAMTNGSHPTAVSALARHGSRRLIGAATGAHAATSIFDVTDPAWTRMVWHAEAPMRAAALAVAAGFVVAASPDGGVHVMRLAETP